MLLPDTGLSEATTLAEHFRQKIESQLIKTKEYSFPLTASFGVSQSTRNNEPLDDLLKRADDALYVAKNSGRNCVMADGKAR